MTSFGYFVLFVFDRAIVGCQDAGCLRAPYFGRVLWISDALCALGRAGRGLAHFHSSAPPDRTRKSPTSPLQVSLPLFLLLSLITETLK